MGPGTGGPSSQLLRNLLREGGGCLTDRDRLAGPEAVKTNIAAGPCEGRIKRNDTTPLPSYSFFIIASSQNSHIAGPCLRRSRGKASSRWSRGSCRSGQSKGLSFTCLFCSPSYPMCTSYCSVSHVEGTRHCSEGLLIHLILLITYG